MARGLHGDDPSRMARTGEIDVTHRLVRDQGRDNGRRILGRVHHNVDGSLREPRRDEDFAKQPVRTGTEFRRLEDDTVATGERPDDRSHAENEGRVPWRDSETNADRLPHRKREAARLVGCQDLAGDAGGGRCRLPHDSLSEMNVKSRPCFRGTRLIHHRGDQIVGPVAQKIGGARDQLAACGRAGLRPLREGCGCGIHGRNGIGFAGRGCGGHHVAGHRVTARERARRRSRRAVDQKSGVEHDVLASGRTRIDFKPCSIDHASRQHQALRGLVVEIRGICGSTSTSTRHGPVVAQAVPQCILQFVGPADTTPRAAEPRRELDEIQIGRSIPRRIAHSKDPAEGTHSAITAVVDDDHRERRAVLSGGP